MRTQPPAPRLAIGQKLFILACALLVGFVGGRSIAEAAGSISPENGALPFERLHGDAGVWIFFSIVLLTLFVIAALRLLLLLRQRVIALLTQVETRPVAWISVTIIACGVVCLLAAVSLQWHQSTSVSASLPAIEMPNMPGMPKGDMRIMNPGGFSIRARSSLMTPITTIGILLAGFVITGIGIWSSIPPRHARASKPVPMAARAAEWGDQGDAQAIRAQPTVDRPRE